MKPITNLAKIGRNEPCYCGSKRKFKRCCIDKLQEKIDGNTPDLVSIAGKIHSTIQLTPQGA